MSIWGQIIQSLGRKNGIEWRPEEYDSNKVGSIEIPDRLSNENAFLLANTVTELYFPIDFYADRASKLRYYLADSNDKELVNSEYNRLIKNINPLYSFSDIIYQYVFSYLSAGYAATLVNVPSSYRKPSVNSISRLDVLQPDLLSIREYNNVSTLDILSLNDLIKEAKYCDVTSPKPIDITRLRIDNVDTVRIEGSNILSKSPLFKAYRPINNLLATYSARYNVYVNNGAAGYLVKKQSNANNINEAIDPTTRADILKDINERNGITGRRNFWGISSVPIEFINTLSDIQKLMPFEETLEDSIKIASVFQIPPELIPRKDQTTFNNKSEAERSVWENGLMSMVETAAANLTGALYLDKVGVKIKADYSTVSSLKTNELSVEDLNTKKLQNLKTLKELQPNNKNIDIEIEKITEGYGKR